jgi:hypothetical protein
VATANGTTGQAFVATTGGAPSWGITGPAGGGTGVANNAAATVTSSGNFAFTRTLTGVTNVTLPTTGTLATLTGTETFTNKTLSSPVISGTPTGVGVLTSDTAQASTSGTVIDFTGIPNWVKRVTVIMNGVSLSGSAFPRFQLGYSGGIESSGYVGYCTQTAAGAAGAASGTAGFDLYIGTASSVVWGQAVFTLVSGTTWVFSFCGGATTVTLASAGNKTLTGALTQIRITSSNGTDTFDEGSINILYE